jgi:hypothetical protein
MANDLEAKESPETPKSTTSSHGKDHGHGPICASGLFKTQDGRSIEIRDVWASNLEEEMEKIREIIEKCPYVAMVRTNDVYICFR